MRLAPCPQQVAQIAQVAQVAQVIYNCTHVLLNNSSRVPKDKL